MKGARLVAAALASSNELRDGRSRSCDGSAVACAFLFCRHMILYQRAAVRTTHVWEFESQVLHVIQSIEVLHCAITAFRPFS